MKQLREKEQWVKEEQGIEGEREDGDRDVVEETDEDRGTEDMEE